MSTVKPSYRNYVIGILLVSGNSVLKVARTHFLAWGVHRARVSHSTFVRERYRKQIWRCAAIFVQVLILLC